jgi:DNA modification methylase
MTNSTLQKNKSVNTLLPEDRPVHDWYRFILSFPPHLVRTYLDKFAVSQTERVLDPFCGTGTTLVECKKRGIPSVGVEANPVAHFASRVKTDWQIDTDALLTHADAVAERATEVLRQQGIIDDPLFFPVNVDVPRHTLRRLPVEGEKLLLQNSISALPLHKTLVLLEQLQANTPSPYAAIGQLAMAKALTTSISNLYFGPEVGVGLPRDDAPVVATWQDHVGSMAKDLTNVQALADTPTVVHLADARTVSDVLPPESIDVVITSPPYPNEKDYTRITRLESVLLGFASTKAELQAFKRTLLRSNSRNVYRGDDDDQWIQTFPTITQLADEIEARRIALNKTSGFERLYAKVTRLYFGGIARHLANLRTVLRPGARLAYVVGDQASFLRVMIRTGQLIEQIAIQLGYESTGIDLFRTRLATATKAQLREEVLTLRWPGNHHLP